MALGWRLLLENAVFVAIATGFLAIAGWAWRDLPAFQLPKPLPAWFKYWFGAVQFLGVLPPLLALGWCWWQGEGLWVQLWLAYFALLALQILAEVLALRRYQSTVWVMVPYLYVPYRLWQLAEGWGIAADQTCWAMQALCAAEGLLWALNYLLDLAQLPRLFRWPGTAAVDGRRETAD